MAANSEVSALALPGPPYGTFTGKEASAGGGPHNPGPLSEVSSLSLTGGLYGSFAGKEASAPAPAADEVFGGAAPTWWLRRRRKDEKDELEQDLRDALLRRNRAIALPEPPEPLPEIALPPLAGSLAEMLASAHRDVIQPPLPIVLPLVAPARIAFDDSEELRLLALLA